MDAQNAKDAKKGMKYKRISKEDRQRLVEMVKDEKITIKMAAQEVGVSPSTARSIIFKFHQEGRFFEPKVMKSR